MLGDELDAGALAGALDANGLVVDEALILVVHPFVNYCCGLSRSTLPEAKRLK